MENHLIQYSSKVENLFFSYLKGFILLETLISELKKIEKFHKQKLNEKKSSPKELWFKLYSDYTGADSIKDLERGLNPLYDTKANIEHVKKCMWIGVSLNNNVGIYFS